MSTSEVLLVSIFTILVGSVLIGSVVLLALFARLDALKESQQRLIYLWGDPPVAPESRPAQPPSARVTFREALPAVEGDVPDGPPLDAGEIERLRRLMDQYPTSSEIARGDIEGHKIE